jgi:hypothetical protein
MQSKGYKIRALNIVYFEGLLADDLTTVNADQVDEWNDVRAIIGSDGRVYMSATATTEPGWYYRRNRMNPGGAAQVAFGQYLDCWRLGKHFKQDALVQCGEIKVYRDSNEDGSRTGDPEETGDYFGCNQHTTGNSSDSAPSDTVGRWSAGCLVGKWASTHYNTFLPICKAMGLKTFDTTLIDGSDFAKYSMILKA